MLILSPRQVRFGSLTLADIAAIIIDRSPARTVEEFTEHGPYAVFADIPVQRLRLHIVQQATSDVPDDPRPGDQAMLTFHTAHATTAARPSTISALCVVLAVQHELSLKHGATRKVTLVPISETGETDPITITPH